jgi:hypothetical protein
VSQLGGLDETVNCAFGDIMQNSQDRRSSA